VAVSLATGTGTLGDGLGDTLTNIRNLTGSNFDDALTGDANQIADTLGDDRVVLFIDEAQNLSMHELKTIITRVGDGTKIILTGDIEQIDNVHVDVFTNGLTYAVERFKEHPIAGHVTLTKGERSELATLASKIL
jgi:ATP-dependent exoDNAse (exonuclease V) alpha subunit